MERKEFYKQLKSFLRELIVVFPEDDDALLAITTSLNLAIIDDDCNEIAIKFYTVLNPHEKLILKRDKSIFTKIKWDSLSYESNLFEKLNSQWNTFSETNQTVIWEYINVLYILSKYTINLN